ncbi:MAG: hypothetical protein P8R42_23570 [Candidatus Binatia bacterium]|nr:hypothetical protein [Candidatus Binatia bacterium]
MATPISIREAKNLPGMRLLLLQGLPSPWSQAAKGIMERKKIPYLLVNSTPDDPPELLREWSGQESYPVAAWEQERPRSGWAEILFLAERVSSEPSLLPATQADRTLFFGLAHEICGEMGLGWCRRLLSIHEGLRTNPEAGFLRHLGQEYGYHSADVAETAIARCVSILHQLDSLLELRRNEGDQFFFGNRLGALDIYWAAFSNLIEPLPPEQCALPDALRPMFTAQDEETRAAFTPALRAHRDFVFHEYLRLPMEL